MADTIKHKLRQLAKRELDSLEEQVELKLLANEFKSHGIGIKILAEQYKSIKSGYLIEKSRIKPTQTIEERVATEQADLVAQRKSGRHFL